MVQLVGLKYIKQQIDLYKYLSLFACLFKK